MKAGHYLILGAVAIGGYFAWKYRAQLIATVAPDPTVQTVAGSTYGGATDVPGNISAALGGVGGGGGNQATVTDPALNAALTGSGAGLDYAGGAVA